MEKNDNKKNVAIDLGKKANAAKIAYENNNSDKMLKNAYKQADTAYKKALSENTQYRKGVVRQEVGRDISRKYLNEAKKVKNMIDNDPTNAQLKKKYSDLMSKHDVERASARRAVEVGNRRSRCIASIKRTATMTTKAAITAAAVGIGIYAVNRYLTSHGVTLNGKKLVFGTQNMSDVANAVKNVKNVMDYMW